MIVPLRRPKLGVLGSNIDTKTFIALQTGKSACKLQIVQKLIIAWLAQRSEVKSQKLDIDEIKLVIVSQNCIGVQISFFSSCFNYQIKCIDQQ